MPIIILYEIKSTNIDASHIFVSVTLFPDVYTAMSPIKSPLFLVVLLIVAVSAKPKFPSSKLRGGNVKAGRSPH